MNNAVDSLFVAGQATFAGGAESGRLTNGALLLFTNLNVAGPGQFSASGSHVTYMVGPKIACVICGLSAGGKQSPLGASRLQKLPAAVAARRAAALAALKDLRASATTAAAGRRALAANLPSRADAARSAASAGRSIGIAAQAPRSASPGAAAAIGRSQLRVNAARGARFGGAIRASGIPILPYSSSAVSIAFADTTGNQFANLRILGGAHVNTNARASGNVVVDTSADIQGSGRLTIAGDLIGSFNSVVESEAIELYGVMADTGFFSPDTTVFSGATQIIPSQVGGVYPTYFNVLVNSPSLGVLGDDNGIYVGGSLLIQNSGQLRVGVPDTTCTSCPATVYVSSALETHGSGTLRMTDSVTTPLVLVDGNALFAGGSLTGLLTTGEIDYYGNFTQSGPTATSFTATPAHLSFFNTGLATQPAISFATPGYAQSHFGTVYVSDTLLVLQSNVFVDGQLQAGGTHILGGQTGVGITSRGANVGVVTFDSTTWTLVDGDSVVNMNSVTFTRQVPDSAQFVVTRSGAGSFASPTSWIFSTVPTGAGLYVRATDTDGVAPVLTLNFIAVTPGATGGLVATSGGAIINWYAP